MSEKTDREAKETVKMARMAIAGALILIILIVVATVVGHS